MEDQTLSDIKGILEDIKKDVLGSISSLRKESGENYKQITDKLDIIDTRLNLIEQRLKGIERWIPVDHDHLKMEKQTA